ncbi:hypothetical protein KL953_24765 [Mycolicibacterium goodii]|uniref:hypothetical protein n=1 Tax=Mycolicibacterium goodii TaxID=134601 RepID=UPI001BDD84C7|nr:hypothetical protein [Mycolicibacterium goodii]MBU8812105.1 hypothetical protein [Mycolicibacterium goodii]
MRFDLNRVTDAATRFWRSRVGRLRTSTVVLIVAFFALWWVQQTYQPAPAPPEAPQVVPPGFVPDPDYTWVPRTNVEAPRTTRTTTPTTTTTTTSPTPDTPTTTQTGPLGPGDTTSPTSPTSPTTTSPGPQTTVVDPDGPGILPPITLPVLPGAAPAPASAPAPEPAAPAPPQ